MIPMAGVQAYPQITFSSDALDICIAILIKVELNLTTAYDCEVS